MTCSEYRSWIGPLVEGDLGKEETRELMSHIESCPECREEYKLLKATVSAVRSLEPVQLPAGFGRDLRKKLLSQPVRPWYARISWAIPATAAAALVLVLTVGSMLDMFSPMSPLGLRSAQEDRVADQPTEDTVGLMTESADPEPDFQLQMLRLSAELVVSDLQGAVTSVTSLVHELKGQVQEGQPEDEDFRLIFQLEKELMEDALRALEELGDLRYQHMEGYDLGEEYMTVKGLAFHLEELVEEQRTRDPEGEVLSRLVEDLSRAQARLERIRTANETILIELLLRED